MDGSDYTRIGSLLNSTQSSTNIEMHQIIIDLNIRADKEVSLFMGEVEKCDLGPFLRTLPGMPEDTKSCALRFLGKVFKFLGPTAMILKYVDIIAEMLSKKCEEKITAFYIEQLLQICQTSDGVRFLIENESVSSMLLLELVAENLQNDSLYVAKHASDVIQTIFSLGIGVNRLLSDDFMKIFKSLLERGAVIRFRVYQLFVDSFVVNDGLVNNTKVVEILELLVKELENDDILSQLNCLEMLCTVALSSSNGLKFIIDCGTLEKLRISLLGKKELDPLQQLLIQGVIKLFGSIATAMPTTILLKFPDFKFFIFENMTNIDMTIKTLCFETIASISSSDEGLNVLYQNPLEFKKAMNTAGKVVLSPVDEDLKAKFIDAIKVILTKSDGDLNGESSNIKRELFMQLSEEPLNLLMSCSQLPFSKIRYSALGAIYAIANHSWSEEYIVKTPGFLEYLMDRQTEVEKEGKELKYHIVLTLSQSKTSEEVLGQDFYNQICSYAREGPFLSEHHTAVDFEMKE